MKTLASATAKAHLSEIFDGLEQDRNDSVMIERNKKPAAFVLAPDVGRLMVLAGYAQGVVSRSVAMKLLGMIWFGELTDALAEAGIDKPVVSGDEDTQMVRQVIETLRPRP